MIILPDKNIPRSKILFPVSRKEWMPKSISLPKDQFGKEDNISFAIKAHTNDGVVCWKGIYKDREDFDAVLWAIANDTLKYQKPLWFLSTPYWDPWLADILTYSFATYNIITSSAGSNQTYTKPSDWNNASNKIECIGGGGSGVVTTNITGADMGGAGGGGAAYSAITNFNFSVASVTVRVGAGGASNISPIGVVFNGGGFAGGNTWFNGTTSPGIGSDNTKCNAVGGGRGNFNEGVFRTFPTNAGNSNFCWGQTKYSGGNAGCISGVAGTVGGGGAGCSTGLGVDGEYLSNAYAKGTGGGAGGPGDAGVGAAGAAGAGGTGKAAGDGTAGTNLVDGTVGAGGGGGAIYESIDALAVAGAAGNYGAASGACGNQGGKTTTSVQGLAPAGGQGLIAITYTPGTTLFQGNAFLLF